MKNIYVVRKNSKNGVPYVQAYADLGYGVCSITFDTAVIVELFGLTFEQVNTLPLDEPILVAKLNMEVK